LSFAGALQYLIPHLAERKTDIEARRRQMFDKRPRVGAIRTLPIGGRRSRLGCKRNHSIRGSNTHLGESPAADRAARKRAPHRAKERIIAAGIKNDKAKSLGLLKDLHDPLDGNSLVLDVDVALKRGVDGYQIIDAAHLDAMPGIEDHRDVGIAHAIGEIAEYLTHIGQTEVAIGFDHFEAHGAKQRFHGIGITGWIHESANMGIGAVADDKRHALFRQREGRPH
jgi:hypothetical protein